MTRRKYGLSLVGVKRFVKDSLEREGYEPRHVEARWLGKWSKPRFGEGEEFRLAAVSTVTPEGRGFHHVSVERPSGKMWVRGKVPAKEEVTE